MKLLALDPGTTHSGAVVYDPVARRVNIAFPEIENNLLREWIRVNRGGVGFDHVAIEMIACYGKPVGREVFETCVWIGRFVERVGDQHCDLVYRRDVKSYLCGSVKAKDPAVRAALLLAFGGSAAAMGTASAPGPLRGVSKHAWPALGVALTWERYRFGRTWAAPFMCKAGG